MIMILIQTITIKKKTYNIDKKYNDNNSNGCNKSGDDNINSNRDNADMNNKHDDADKDNDVKKVNDAIAFKKVRLRHTVGENFIKFRS